MHIHMHVHVHIHMCTHMDVYPACSSLLPPYRYLMFFIMAGGKGDNRRSLAEAMAALRTADTRIMAAREANPEAFAAAQAAAAAAAAAGHTTLTAHAATAAGGAQGAAGTTPQRTGRVANAPRRARELAARSTPAAQLQLNPRQAVAAFFVSLSAFMQQHNVGLRVRTYPHIQTSPMTYTHIYVLIAVLAR